MFRAKLDQIWERPERGLAALVLAQGVFWFLAPALSHSAPPLDVVEMYAWGGEGVVATFKHPNSPGLILEAVRRLTGQAGWPAYAVSQVFIGVTFWAVFALGRDLLGPRRALAGVLMLTGVYFFSWPSPEFNHNVAQMPFWALTALLLWRVSGRGERRAGLLLWAALGFVAGLSLWAKYSSLMLLAPAGVWMLWDKDARKTFSTPGPYVTLACFALAAAPQVLWLTQNDFAPFAYAARRAGGGGFLPTLEFLLPEIANHLPMLLILACAGWFGRKAADTAETQPADRRARNFLLLIGLGPLLLTLAPGLAGSGLRSSWGAPMFNLSGLLIVALWPQQFSQERFRRLAIGAGALVCVIPALYFAHMRFGPAFTGKALKGNWPQETLTRVLEDEWAARTNGAPLRIVAGDIWTAGLVGMADAQPPSILIDDDLGMSPWVSAERLRKDGALMVWRKGGQPPAAFATHALADSQVVSVPFQRFPNLAPLEIAYFIIPPQTDSRGE